MFGNVLNKKGKSIELDRLAAKYINFIEEFLKDEEKVSISNLNVTKKYKHNGFLFSGQEILDHIQKRLVSNYSFIYEVKIVDNIPVVKRSYRTVLDDELNKSTDDDLLQKGLVFTSHSTGEVYKINNDNVIATIEDLKAKLNETLEEVKKLNGIINKKDADNRKIFFELVEAYGGLYEYASKKKLILMLSRVLKEYKYYNDKRGTKYSFEDLKDKQKNEIINVFYEKVLK